MRTFFDSVVLGGTDEGKPMTFWSCVLYVIANVTGLFLYWLYQRQRVQRLRQEELGCLDNTSIANGSNYNLSCSSNGSSPTAPPGGNYNFYINYNYQQRQQHYRGASQSSLLSILGLTYNGYKTFFAFEDRFCSFDDVAKACRRAGLETCGLIVGVDFSASNEWQGRKTFSGQNLHKIVPGKILNPYQKVISIMGKTLESFDEDNMIPAFGFGDTRTTGKSVFSFKELPRAEDDKTEKDEHEKRRFGSNDIEFCGKGGSEEMDTLDAEDEVGFGGGKEVPCKGFTEVLDRYSEIANTITLGGPTNFAPIINKAVSIVRRQKKYHILIVIADGQVTEQASTIQAIVEASLYPLSIVMVGVGDGPWGTMDHFDNSLPDRYFDNFQFVNFHAVVDRCRKNPEASFALQTMMEIPDQYKTIKALGYLDNSPNSDHGVSTTANTHVQPDANLEPPTAAGNLGTSPSSKESSKQHNFVRSRQNCLHKQQGFT